MSYPFIENFYNLKVVYVVAHLEKDGNCQLWRFLDSDMHWSEDIVSPGVLCKTSKEAENMKKCWDLRKSGVECEIRKVVCRFGELPSRS